MNAPTEPSVAVPQSGAALDEPTLAIRSVAESGDQHRGWCRAHIVGGEAIMGDVIGFDTHIVVIAVASLAPSQLQNVTIGAAATLAIGLHGKVAKGMAASVATTLTDSRGRSCIAFDLLDETGTVTRRVDRIPFQGRVDAMLIDGRGKIDSGTKLTAFNLSKRGMGVLSEREIARNSHLLLRFLVPQNRSATVQVRAVVAYCQTVGDKLFQVGLEFERMGAAQMQLVGRALEVLAAAEQAERAVAAEGDTAGD